jgi:hypothetical protein
MARPKSYRRPIERRSVTKILNSKPNALHICVTCHTVIAVVYVRCFGMSTIVRDRCLELYLKTENMLLDLQYKRQANASPRCCTSAESGRPPCLLSGRSAEDVGRGGALVARRRGTLPRFAQRRVILFFCPTRASSANQISIAPGGSVRNFVCGGHNGNEGDLPWPDAKSLR